MARKCRFIALLLGGFPLIPRSAVAQIDTTYCGSGGHNYAPRRAVAGGTFIAANAALFVYEKKAWWSGEKSKGFFFRPDWDMAFRDQDKFGHLYGGYHLARGGDALLRAACVSEPKAIALAAVYATAFQLQIEIWDGQYEKYGFSYADLLANTTGMAFAVLQHNHPQLRAFKPTFSYWPTQALRNASGTSELRPSLDYSGQTYWVSTDVNQLLSENAKQYWPSLLRVSVGHSITDWIDPGSGNILRAKRKILLSVDLDPEKLPGDNVAWKRVKHTLSFIRFPAPALQLTPELKLIGVYK